jgi:hypothetical protein
LADNGIKGSLGLFDSLREKNGQIGVSASLASVSSSKMSLKAKLGGGGPIKAETLKEKT